MVLKECIPNLITSLNLLSGIIAVFYAIFGNLELVALFVIIGMVFDFFDGFAARLLGTEGALGKQLDSLADMITFGLAPGIVLFQLLLKASTNAPIEDLFNANSFYFLPFIGLLVSISSAFRLANFNNDQRQDSSFIGLPTPANALFIVSLPLIIAHSDITFFVNSLGDKFILVGISILSSYLLNSKLPLFSLKFKNFTWKDNSYRFIFISISLILLVIFEYVAIPLAIMLYILFSTLESCKKK